MTRYDVAHLEVLVGDDNAGSELAAARRLGMRCVRIMRPRVRAASEVAERVSGLVELRDPLAR